MKSKVVKQALCIVLSAAMISMSALPVYAADGTEPQVQEQSDPAGDGSENSGSQVSGTETGTQSEGTGAQNGDAAAAVTQTLPETVVTGDSSQAVKDANDALDTASKAEDAAHDATTIIVTIPIIDKNVTIESDTAKLEGEAYDKDKNAKDDVGAATGIVDAANKKIDTDAPLTGEGNGSVEDLAGQAEKIIDPNAEAAAGTPADGTQGTAAGGTTDGTAAVTPATGDTAKNASIADDKKAAEDAAADAAAQADAAGKAQTSADAIQNVNKAYDDKIVADNAAADATAKLDEANKKLTEAQAKYDAALKISEDAAVEAQKELDQAKNAAADATAAATEADRRAQLAADAVKKVADALQQGIDNANKTMEDHAKELEQKKQTLTDALDALSAADTDLKGKVEDLKKQIAELDTAIKTLKDAKKTEAEKKAAYDTLEAQCKAVQDQYAALQVDLGAAGIDKDIDKKDLDATVKEAVDAYTDQAKETSDFYDKNAKYLSPDALAEIQKINDLKVAYANATDDNKETAKADLAKELIKNEVDAGEDAVVKETTVTGADSKPISCLELNGNYYVYEVNAETNQLVITKLNQATSLGFIQYNDAPCEIHSNDDGTLYILGADNKQIKVEKDGEAYNICNEITTGKTKNFITNGGLLGHLNIPIPDNTDSFEYLKITYKHDSDGWYYETLNIEKSTWVWTGFLEGHYDPKVYDKNYVSSVAIPTVVIDGTPHDVQGNASDGFSYIDDDGYDIPIYYEGTKCFTKQQELYTGAVDGATYTPGSDKVDDSTYINKCNEMQTAYSGYTTAQAALKSTQDTMQALQTRYNEVKPAADNNDNMALFNYLDSVDASTSLNNTLLSDPDKIKDVISILTTINDPNTSDWNRGIAYVKLAGELAGLLPTSTDADMTSLKAAAGCFNPFTNNAASMANAATALNSWLSWKQSQVNVVEAKANVAKEAVETGVAVCKVVKAGGNTLEAASAVPAAFVDYEGANLIYGNNGLVDFAKDVMTAAKEPVDKLYEKLADYAKLTAAAKKAAEDAQAKVDALKLQNAKAADLQAALDALNAANKKYAQAQLDEAAAKKAAEDADSSYQTALDAYNLLVEQERAAENNKNTVVTTVNADIVAQYAAAVTTATAAGTVLGANRAAGAVLGANRLPGAADTSAVQNGAVLGAKRGVNTGDDARPEFYFILMAMTAAMGGSLIIAKRRREAEEVKAEVAASAEKEVDLWA